MNEEAEFYLLAGRWETLAEEVADELVAQLNKWGYQDHPLYRDIAVRGKYVTLSDMWHEVNDLRVANGTLAWDGILLEEVYEALSEPDTKKRRVELVQVAAVALAMAECDERNGR